MAIFFMQVLILSNQHSERKSVVILGKHLFFVDPKNVTAFHFKSELELDLLFQFAPYPEFLTGENIELICNAYLKNCNEYPNEANRLFSDEDIDMNRRVISHATKNHWVMRKLMALKDLRVIKILMERPDIEASTKDELLLLLINIKPDGDIIKYIAQYSRSAVVIDKLLSKDYNCRVMSKVLGYLLVNKNWPSDIYTKIYYWFVKASNLFDYLVYETEIKELYTRFLSNDSLPNHLIECILLTNIRFCDTEEKIQRILSRKNLPQYIAEYSVTSLLGEELISNIPYFCIRKQHLKYPD
jgi:hypothetical protein